MRSPVLIAFFLAGCGSPRAGVQETTVSIAVPAFTIAPGAEVFPCFFTSVPEEARGAVLRIRSTMAPGSHHLVLFRLRERIRPDGTMEDCTGLPGFTGDPERMPQWIYSAQEPEDGFTAPEGIGIPLPAGAPLAVSLHYLNAGDAPIDAQVTIELDYSTAGLVEAGSFVSYDPDVYVAPQSQGQAGGHCSLPSGAKVFTLTTHSHRFSTSVRLDRWAAGASFETLLESTDWEHPDVGTWSEPDWLTFTGAEELGYTCRYVNGTDAPVTAGESAATDEMCMAIGWYFPGGGKNTFCVGNASLTL